MISFKVSSKTHQRIKIFFRILYGLAVIIICASSLFNYVKKYQQANFILADYTAITVPLKLEDYELKSGKREDKEIFYFSYEFEAQGKKYQSNFDASGKYAEELLLKGLKLEVAYSNSDPSYFGSLNGLKKQASLKRSVIMYIANCIIMMIIALIIYAFTVRGLFVVKEEVIKEDISISNNKSPSAELGELLTTMIEEAVNSFNKEDYQKLLNAANAGDAKAILNVATMHYQQENYQQALYWFLKAAAKGQSPAMLMIGTMYEENKGLEQDYEQAMYWYLKAAEKNDDDAMVNIGYLYNEGLGVQQDYQQAMHWYLKAAEKSSGVGKGYISAMVNIGSMYAEGLGVKQDYQQAMHWYLKAVEKDNSDAMANIGYLYDEGLGVQQDYQQAMDWYLKAANKGNANAMYNIAELYRDGKGVTKNLSKAKKWFKKAADLGDNEAREELEKLQ